MKPALPVALAAIGAAGVIGCGGGGPDATPSPTPEIRGPIEHNPVANQPHSVFFVVEDGEEEVANNLAGETARPKIVQAYDDDGAPWLIDDPEVVTDILEWLTDKL